MNRPNILGLEMMTYKERVDEFWNWFGGVAERFFNTIENGNCGDLQEETTNAVNKLGLGAWVYGPGPKEKGGHSLTISGEGVIHKQFLTEYWLSKAPTLEGWTFYAARQPENFGACIEINGLKIDFKAIWVKTKIDEENENIDLEVWHHEFPNLEDSAKFRITFLVLDEVLGEYGTGNWIGEINFASTAPQDIIPITELSEFVDQLQASTQWEKCPPTETYQSYRVTPCEEDFPRSDLMTLSTSNSKLVWEYLNAEGDYESPIKGTGADFIFISFPMSILPKGAEVDFRADLEDSLETQLKASGAGQLFGGSLGEVNAYIDLAIYDGERSIEIIKSVLKERSLPSETTIHFFDKDREIIDLREQIHDEKKPSFLRKLFKR